MLTAEQIKNRIDSIENFIESGDYKNYKNWKQSPMGAIFSWLTNGIGKKYLTNELKEKLDNISYFEYMSASSCPYPTKENHKWCRKCKTEQSVKDFRSAYICKKCALKYRQDTYYEKDKIQGRIDYHNNPNKKLYTISRVYINKALKGKFKKSKRTKEILGLEWDEFREYIESKFEPWMNWDNHGHGEGCWVIQHIIPKILAKSEQDIYRLNYYKNLIPWGYTENSKFKDKILINQLNDWHYENCMDFILDNEDKVRIELEYGYDENDELILFDCDLFIEHEKKLGRIWKQK